MLMLLVFVLSFCRTPDPLIDACHAHRSRSQAPTNTTKIFAKFLHWKLAHAFHLAHPTNTPVPFSDTYKIPPKIRHGLCTKKEEKSKEKRRGKLTQKEQSSSLEKIRTAKGYKKR